MYPVKAYDAMGYLYSENQEELDAQKGTEANTPKRRNIAIELDGAIKDDVVGKDKSGKKGKGKAAKGRETTLPPPPPPAINHHAQAQARDH